MSDCSINCKELPVVGCVLALCDSFIEKYAKGLTPSISCCCMTPPIAASDASVVIDIAALMLCLCSAGQEAEVVVDHA